MRSVPAATPPAASSRSRLRQLGNTVVVLGVIALAATLASYVMPERTPSPAEPPAAAPPIQRAADTQEQAHHTVVYQLDGDTGARDLTYAVQGEELVQADRVTAPWSTAFTRTGEGGYSSLTARNDGPGSLRCRILVDGAVVAEKTVHGEGAQLTCAAA